MIWITWSIAGLGLIVAAVTLALAYAPRGGQRELAQLVRALDLEITPEVEAVVLPRLTVRRRGASIGAILGILATVAVLSDMTDAPEQWQQMFPLIISGSIFAGLGVGSAVAAALARPRTLDERPRIARAETVGINDYAPWILRWGARIPVAAVALMLLASLLISWFDGAEEASPLVLPGGLLALAAIGSLVFFELASRALLRRGQPAGSAAELVWDDAVRSVTIQDLAGAPLTLGLYSLSFMTLDLAGRLQELVPMAGILIGANIFFNVMMFALVLGLLFYIASKPQRHFLYRLWPERAAAGPSVVGASPAGADA